MSSFEILDSELKREELSNTIKSILTSFDVKITDPNYKKGIYIYGSPGSGKTYFIKRLLNEINYDIIHYSAGDVRNKQLIDNIASNNMSSQNVLKMMYGQKQKIVIVMDEIDGMNNGDKGSITALIKLIRQKKTKKQKLEHQTLNPIICIGNYFIDKKIKELMKVCHVFELKSPAPNQVISLLNRMNISPSSHEMLLNYIQGDLHKLQFVYKMYCIYNSNFNDYNFQFKINNDDSKNITHKLLQEYIPLRKHGESINETDRTIVALLWHENIIDSLDIYKGREKWEIYSQILDKTCFADYIDRITFQNQIWQFNEMSSLIKTFYTNKLFHDFLSRERIKAPVLNDIRFTKVLTKYSTEYNNSLFIQNLCNQLEMDKKDLLAMFQELRIQFKGASPNEICFKVEQKINNSEINHLDIKRMYRYLDKNVKKDLSIAIEELDELNDE
jgi:SpoVK/Ycf46/Vps4 family AAA+-type ATPase